MCKKNLVCLGEKKQVHLDTLAQLGTNSPNSSIDAVSNGLNLTISNEKTLKKRANRNYLKNSLTLGLVDVLNDKKNKRLITANTAFEKEEAINRDKDILRSYWNMYHCSAKLVKKQGKITGQYCKNRLCLVCNSIRTAVLLKKYKPVFDDWNDDSYFVTLTAPTVYADTLGDRLDEMHSIFVDIKDVLKKRHQRNNCTKFQGIRKLECTYNSFDDKYHPHFHIIIKGEENARFVYSEWLNRTKHLGTSENAQDCRKTEGNSAMEVFKYFTKLISSSKKDRLIYLQSIDIIFRAFRKRRVIQSFGFQLPKDNDGYDIELEEDELLDSEYEVFKWNYSDWYSEITGEGLTGFEVSEGMKELTGRMVKGLRKNS